MFRQTVPDTCNSDRKSSVGDGGQSGVGVADDQGWRQGETKLPKCKYKTWLRSNGSSCFHKYRDTGQRDQMGDIFGWQVHWTCSVAELLICYRCLQVAWEVAAFRQPSQHFLCFSRVCLQAATSILLALAPILHFSFLSMNSCCSFLSFLEYFWLIDF